MKRLWTFLLVLVFCLTLPLGAAAQEAVGPVQPDFEYGTGFADLSKERQDEIVAGILSWHDGDPSGWTVQYFTGERAYFAGIFPEIYQWAIKDLDTASPYEQMKIRSARNYAISHANAHGYGWCTDQSGSPGDFCSFDLDPEKKVITITPGFHELFPLAWEEPDYNLPLWEDLTAAEARTGGNQALVSGMALSYSMGRQFTYVIVSALCGLNGGSLPESWYETYCVE